MTGTNIKIVPDVVKFILQEYRTVAEIGPNTVGILAPARK